MSNNAIMHAPTGMTAKAQEQYFVQVRKYNNMRDAAAEASKRVLRGVAGIATGVVLGYIEGRYDYGEVHGVPMSGVVAAVGSIAGMFLDGELGEIAAATGIAGSAVWGHGWGLQLGQNQKAKAGSKTTNSQPAAMSAGAGYGVPHGYSSYQSARRF